MDNLKLITILQILPNAIKDCDYETIKKLEEIINRRKLQIFNPPYLEYFHESPNIRQYRSLNYDFYRKFRKLKLSGERRIKDPKTLKQGESIYILLLDRTDLFNREVYEIPHPVLFRCKYKGPIYIRYYKFEGIGEDRKQVIDYDKINGPDFELGLVDIKQLTDTENSYCLEEGLIIDSRKIDEYKIIPYHDTPSGRKGKLYIYK